MIDKIKTPKQYIQITRITNELQDLADALKECGGVLARDADEITRIAQGIQDFRDEIADHIGDDAIEQAWANSAIIKSIHTGYRVDQE
jgi:hypothetical protein